jgi:uncharacterized iron-regulated membrane protein
MEHTMQGFWLIFGLLFFIGGPIAGLVLMSVVINKVTAPWRHRAMARQLDAIAHEHNEVQKHRKVWVD